MRQFWNWNSGGNDEQGTLIGRARAGDRTAFDRLVSLHEAALRGFLHRRVANEAVEDVMQETLLAAWIALPQYHPDPRATFQTWLCRIASNKSIDWLRGHARRSAKELDLADFEPFLSVPDGVATLENDLLLRDLLTCLPNEQRTVLSLYYADGLTLREIADREQRNLSTVKYHFYRAHAVLTDRMKQAMAEEGR